MYFDSKYGYAVWAGSFAVGLSILVLVFFLRLYVPAAPYLIPLDSKANNSLALAILIVILPVSIMETINQNYMNAVAKNIPRFLRDVSESVRAGLTLPRAIIEASKSQDGPISKQMQRALSKFSFGKDFSESINEAGKRLRHPNAVQLSAILVEAHASGGKMSEVLTSAVELYSVFEEHREQKRTELRPYALLVYIAISIYLIVAYISITQFLSSVLPLLSTTQGLGLAGNIDLDYFKSIFFWGGVLEGLFGGLVAGKIADGSTASGLKHAVVLITATIVFFNLLIL